MKKLIPEKCSDAFLVKGYYENDPEIGEALGKKLSDYYFENYYGLFQIKQSDAEEIFQMAAKALLVNIKLRRIYVNDEGELIGSNNKPFSCSLTTYFMSIAKNMYREWLRLQRNTPPPDYFTIQSGGFSFPYERFEEEKGLWFWYINGESTGIEVKKGLPGKKSTKYMPYIGEDLHWWIDTDEIKADIGVLYNDILYDDKQITMLSKVARKIAQMNCVCKEILTYSLYMGKTNAEIAQIENYANPHVVATHRHECLQRLRSYVNNPLNC